ncbi:lysozyme inhibitor LprI family protein [Xanthomonas maliensis]|uniref:lysozyme inhibitor LprI family protein n=1 Tax=Xanthomonas maliensis TaxID=1321368 RepID=UPI00039F7CB6|nr:lysozyme inhibitor LprI family protein [Xanthomonas maliensis]KAB7772298.1 DUF1311 domain-containing protein [Xanthomonas maliensis]
MSRRPWSTALLLGSAVALTASAAVAASFDCKQARTAVEQRLCAVPALGRLDEQVDEAYQAVRQLTPRAALADLREQQRAWLRQRNACAPDATLDDCLRRSQQSREKELTTALASQRQALDRIVARIPQTPAAAARQLRDYDTPLASAWLVYLQQFVPAAGVDAALARTRYASARSALGQQDAYAASVLDDLGDKDSAARALTLLRMWIERTEGDASEVHCFVFAAQGELAYEAFGPLYGSTRDSFAPICAPQGGLFELPVWTRLGAAFAPMIEAVGADAGTMRFASFAEWRVIDLRATVSPLLYLTPALRERYGDDPDQGILNWDAGEDDVQWPLAQRKAAAALLPEARKQTAAWLVREKQLPADQAQQAAAAIVAAWVNARLGFEG